MTGASGDGAVEVLHLAEVGSTNDEAMARLRAGAGPLWVRGDRQTTGRGRRGRPWSSPAGNLYASYGVALAPSASTHALGLLPLAAANALAEAIERASPIRPSLKWPNDVMLEGKKAAGILLESEGAPRRLVVGFGVNIAHAPDIEGATRLHDHAPEVDADTLFAALRDTLPAAIAVLLAPGGVAATRAAWLSRAVGIGRPVTVRFDVSVREGRFVGLDDAGRLILADAHGATSLIAAGDVFIRATGQDRSSASDRGAL